MSDTNTERQISEYQFGPYTLKLRHGDHIVPGTLFITDKKTGTRKEVTAMTNSPQACRLLVYLLDHPSGVDTSVIMDIFWGKIQSASANKNLTQLVKRLRAILGDTEPYRYIQRGGSRLQFVCAQVQINYHGCAVKEPPVSRTPANPPPAAPTDTAQSDGLCRLLRQELQGILNEASFRLRRRFNTLAELAHLLVGIQVARGLRPKLSQHDYEELEARRVRGDYSYLQQLERSRFDLRDQETVQQVLKRQVIDWETIRMSAKRAVLLADPGYGKTALLWLEVGRRCDSALKIRATATSNVDDCAVFFRCSDLSTSPSNNLLTAILECLTTRHDLSPAVSDDFRTLLSSGQCLIALDALDEVPEAERHRFIARLNHFLLLQPNACVLLSSRLGGYSDIQGIDDEWHLELLSLQRDQVKQAAQLWFRTEADANGFLKQLCIDPDLAELFRCPLLLRFACQLTEDALHKGCKVPTWRGKAELYDAIFAGLLEHWTAHATVPPNREQQASLIAFAGRVALRLWRKEARQTVWPQEEIWEAIETIRPDFVSLNRREDLLGDLLVAGIIVPVATGGTAFMFTHRTFGEYLVGRCLAHLENEDSTWLLLDRKVWDSAWHEVIKFMTTGLSMGAADRLLQFIGDSTKDDFCRHRLALAIECLRELQHSALPRSHFGRQLTTEGLTVFWNAICSPFAPAVAPLRRVMPALVLLDVDVDGVPFMKWLQQQLQSERAREATEMLQAVGHSMLTPSLLGHLASLCLAEDPYVRWTVSNTFHTLQSAAACEETISTLLRVSYEHPDQDEPLVCIGLLGPNAAIPEVIHHLLQLCQTSTTCWDVAALTLGRLGSAAATDEVLNTLLYLSTKTVSDEAGRMECARARVAYTLVRLNAPARAADLLAHVRHLGNAKDPHLRSMAGCILMYLILFAKESRPEALELWIRLTEDQDETVRYAATANPERSLWAETRTPNEAVIFPLLRRLRDESGRVREEAGNALLANLTKAVPPEILHKVLQELLSMCSESDSEVVCDAISLMTYMGSSDVWVSKQMLPVLKRLCCDTRPDIRRAALLAMLSVKSWARQEQDIAELYTLSRDSDEAVRCRAMYTLNKILDWRIRPEDVPLFLELCVDSYYTIRMNAVEALGRVLTDVSEEVLSLLTKLSEDEDYGVRADTAVTLGLLASKVQEPALVHLLYHLCADKWKRVRMNAASALGRLIKEGRAEVGLLVSLLSTNSWNSMWSAAVAINQLVLEGVRLFEEPPRPETSLPETLVKREVTELSKL